MKHPLSCQSLLEEEYLHEELNFDRIKNTSINHLDKQITSRALVPLPTTLLLLTFLDEEKNGKLFKGGRAGFVTVNCKRAE